MRYLLLSVLVVCVIGVMIPSVLGDEIFDRKKIDILSSLSQHNQGYSNTGPNTWPYHVVFDRDFTKEQGVTETNYQLYKIKDSYTKAHVGDLRFYLGSSEWWDENAELQEDDTSGFENIFKVKIFLMSHLSHKVTEQDSPQQMTDHLTTALHILVPEWSNEVDDVLDNWFVDSINFSERNENGKRENSIMTENKEIKVFHDDLDYGSMTVIVTENADTISLGGVTTGTTITVTIDKAFYIHGETIQILIQSAPNQDVRLAVKDHDSRILPGVSGDWEVDPFGYVTVPLDSYAFLGTYTIQAQHIGAHWESFTEPQAYFDVYDDDSVTAESIEATYSAEKTVSEESKISGGCGEGTVLVNGVCQLAEPVDASRPDTFTNGLIFVLILAAFSPIIIIPLIRYRKNKATYNKQYGYEKPSQKPAKKKETSAFCENCGNSLKKTAKFCGGCGTPRS